MTNALATLKAPQGIALTPERVGQIHEALATFEKLSDTLRTQLKAYVTEHGPAPRPDGKLVSLVERPFSNLSQASIKRAMGAKADKMLATLEENGSIERGTRLELRAVNEKGG